MMVIRTEQLQAFRRAEWQTFLRNIAAEARAVLASRGDPRANAPLEEAVADAVRLGQYHGFRARPALMSFARLVVVNGPGWETPAVRTAFNDDTMTVEAKLDILATAVNG